MTTTPPQRPRRYAIHLSARLLRARDRAGDEGGQAMVEFALVSVLLLLIVFGITQFGLALNATNDETQLASVVARYAAVNYNPSSNQTLAAWALQQADTSLLSASNGGSVEICFPNGTSNIGDPVKVIVKTTMDWQPLYGVSQLVGGGIPATSAITGSAVMRLEATPSVYTGTTPCSS